MLQKIPASDVIRVLKLLDAYMNEKVLNNVLTAWKKLKQCSQRPKNAFSTSSFARNPSKNSRNLDVNPYLQSKSIRNNPNNYSQRSEG